MRLARAEVIFGASGVVQPHVLKAFTALQYSISVSVCVPFPDTSRIGRRNWCYAAAAPLSSTVACNREFTVLSYLRQDLLHIRFRAYVE